MRRADVLPVLLTGGTERRDQMEEGLLEWACAFWEDMEPEEMMTVEDLRQQVLSLTGQEFVMSVPIGGTAHGR